MASKSQQRPNLRTPTDLDPSKIKPIAEALNGLVADGFTLYVKTKNFHWHMSGPHFRDYHLMLDEQADQIFASIDPLAERVRKLGAKTQTSIASIARTAKLRDNESSEVDPQDMLNELMEDNKAMARSMRDAHKLCDDAEDSGTAGLLETFIDETERRTWFLFEASQAADQTGH